MKKSIYVFLSLFLAVATSHAQICFTLHADYPTGTSPVSIVTADFNNDGKADIATCDQSDNIVSVFFGDGAGNFSPVAATYTTVAGPQALTVGDLNGDNFQDLIYVNIMGGNINTLLNDGTGGFVSDTSFASPSFPQAMGTADFNGDGFTDLVTANYSNGKVSLFLGNGAGNFATNTDYSVGTNPNGIVCVDLNGDLKPDVVTSNYGSNNMSVLLNNGSGGFAPRVNYTASTNPGGLVAVDFDGDGDKDIAVCHIASPTQAISIFLNNGSGGMGTANNFNCGFGNLNSITNGDFNGDGKQDLAVPTDMQNSAAVFLGNGSGGFTPAGSCPVDFGPRRICSADFNADGRSDLATSNQNSNSMSVILDNPVLPVVHAVASDTSVCQGDMLTLHGTVSSGTATYSWTPTMQPGVPTDNVPFQVMGGFQTTFTVTGVTTDGCSDTDTLTIRAYMRPNIYGNVPSPVCSGQSVLFNQGSPDSGVTLSWSDGVQIGVPYFPASSHTYTLTGTGPTGCTSYTTTTLNVTPGPTAVIAPVNVGCENDPVTLSSTGSGGGNNYQWTGPQPLVAAGNTPSGTSTDVTEAGTYTLQLINTSTGCSDTATVTVTFIPAPTVSASADHSVICPGTSVTFTGSGANNYSWSGGVTDGVPHVVNASQTYTVTGTDLNGCDATATVAIIINTPPAPDICRITVDSLSHNNVIYWDKTIYPMAENFYIYRDTANNAYGLIGVVPYDSLSEFTDTLRSLYAANGDPNVSSWRYKIAIMDTCGTLGPKGLYHQSIFMQNNTGNFSWSEYKIEGQGTPVSGLNNYVFKRDNLSNGNYAIIQVLSASSTSYTDPNYATYIGTGTWRTETAWNSGCISSMRIDGSGHVIFGAINTSRSNIKSPSSVGMKEVKGGLNVSIYPVPAATSLTVELPNASDETSIEMTNALGQSVYSVKTKQLKNTIDCSAMQSGVYFITVRSEKGQSIRKMIIQ